MQLFGDGVAADELAPGCARRSFDDLVDRAGLQGRDEAQPWAQRLADRLVRDEIGGVLCAQRAEHAQPDRRLGDAFEERQHVGELIVIGVEQPVHVVEHDHQTGGVVAGHGLELILDTGPIVAAVGERLGERGDHPGERQRLQPDATCALHDHAGQIDELTRNARDVRFAAQTSALHRLGDTPTDRDKDCRPSRRGSATPRRAMRACCRA